MDREGVRRAGRLLEKALSTDSEPEALALLEKAYPILAQVINAAEAELPPPPGGRRRERRFLKDRRAGRRQAASAGDAPVRTPKTVPGARSAYRDATAPPRGSSGDMDLNA